MIIKALYKIVFILLTITFFLAISFLANLVFINNKIKRAKISAFLMKYTSTVILFALNITTKYVSKKDKIKEEKGSLIVANHTSYLDIFLMSKKYRAIFITSTDMKKSFGLSLFVKISNSVFVDRSNHSNIKNENIEVANYLKNGINVVLFPESTTTNGEAVKEFKPSLFESVIISMSKVVPVCIKYKKVNGTVININNRNLVFWYGEMLFLPHFLRLLFVEPTTIVSTQLDEINYDISKTRKDLALLSYTLISNYYKKNSLFLAA